MHLPGFMIKDLQPLSTQLPTSLREQGILAIQAPDLLRHKHLYRCILLSLGPLLSTLHRADLPFLAARFLPTRLPVHEVVGIRTREIALLEDQHILDRMYLTKTHDKNTQPIIAELTLTGRLYQLLNHRCIYTGTVLMKQVLLGLGNLSRKYPRISQAVFDLVQLPVAETVPLALQEGLMSGRLY